MYTAIASPVEVADAVGAFKAAFLYSTNWYFIHQSTGYFGADIARQPGAALLVAGGRGAVLPAVAAAARRAVRADAARSDAPRQIARDPDRGRRRRASRRRCGRCRSAASNPNRAYYGTDTRAYELLAGALARARPGARRARAALPAVARAVATVVERRRARWCWRRRWVDLDAIERGIAVTIATCVLIVALEAADGGVVKRVLSTAPVVYLGKISYGTYLWHWLVDPRHRARGSHLSTDSHDRHQCSSRTALASLSYEILERPVRIPASSTATAER